MRALVIINPTAGGGLDATGLARRLEAAVGADVELSGNRERTVELASGAAGRGYSRVIAVGGDGTVRDVAHGLWDAHVSSGREIPAPLLGLIPAGTGNDLARALDLPRELEAATRVCAGEHSRAIDLVRASGAGEAVERTMTNAAVAGFCGRIGESMKPAFRRRWRRLAYPLAALRELRNLRPYDVHLETDGEAYTVRALMVIVANGRFAGGHLPLVPGARPDDGLLDVMWIEPMGPAAVARLVPRVFAGRHGDHPGVRTVRVRVVRLVADPSMWINLDGDTWRAGDARFQVLPGALRVLVR